MGRRITVDFLRILCIVFRLNALSQDERRGIRAFLHGVGHLGHFARFLRIHCVAVGVLAIPFILLLAHFCRWPWYSANLVCAFIAMSTAVAGIQELMEDQRFMSGVCVGIACAELVAAIFPWSR